MEVLVIVNLCKKYDAKIILTSDAHICVDTANYEFSINTLKEIDFPNELIINEPSKLVSYFHSKGKLDDFTLSDLENL